MGFIVEQDDLLQPALYGRLKSYHLWAAIVEPFQGELTKRKINALTRILWCPRRDSNSDLTDYETCGRAFTKRHQAGLNSTQLIRRSQSSLYLPMLPDKIAPFSRHRQPGQIPMFRPHDGK